MTSRLEADGMGVRRETAAAWALVVRVVGSEVDADLVAFVTEDFDFEECFEERDLVLKGFATGARLIEPSGFFAGVVELGFFFLVAAVSAALDTRLQERARRRSAVMRRRSDIYCTPMGLVVWSG